MVYTLNSDEVFPNYKPVGWGDLEGLWDGAFLADDLMRQSDANVGKLQRLLNFTCRHQRVSPALLLCHTLRKTNLHSLIEGFNEYHFTMDRGNVISLGLICDALKFGPALKQSFAAQFLADTSQYGIYVLDKNRRTFCKAAPAAGALAAAAAAAPLRDLEPYRRTAEKFFPHFCVDPKRTMVIFDYLLDKIPLSGLNPDDLTISLKKKESGTELTLSLLDYLLALTNETRPSGDIVALHRYVNKHARLPACFVRNRHLQRA